MSRYYTSYNQYLGANRCCNINSAGPPGPTGATGATGPTGATGATGATGPTLWTNTGNNIIYYTGNVVINGELDVSGGVITTTSPYGVRYNYYNNGTPITSNPTINASYLYQIVACSLTNFNNYIDLPDASSGFTDGDWIIITNLSGTTLAVNQLIGGTIVANSTIYQIPRLGTGNVNSAKFIYHSQGYPNPSVSGPLLYWIVI